MNNEIWQSSEQYKLTKKEFHDLYTMKPIREVTLKSYLQKVQQLAQTKTSILQGEQDLCGVYLILLSEKMRMEISTGMIVNHKAMQMNMAMNQHLQTSKANLLRCLKWCWHKGIDWTFPIPDYIIAGEELVVSYD